MALIDILVPGRSWISTRYLQTPGPPAYIFPEIKNF